MATIGPIITIYLLIGIGYAMYILRHPSHFFSISVRKYPFLLETIVFLLLVIVWWIFWILDIII